MRLLVKKCAFYVILGEKVKKKVQKIKKPDTYMDDFVKNRCFWNSAHLVAENFIKNQFFDQITQKPKISRKNWYFLIIIDSSFKNVHWTFIIQISGFHRFFFKFLFIYAPKIQKCQKKHWKKWSFFSFPRLKSHFSEKYEKVKKNWKKQTFCVSCL